MAWHKKMVPVLGHSWSGVHRPAVNTQATITITAPGAGYRLVCTGLTVVLTAGTSNPSANVVNVSLIDGASGGSTYLWGTVLGVPATAGLVSGVARSGLWIGSADTAMTLEFASAAGTDTFESVSFEGFVQRAI